MKKLSVIILVIVLFSTSHAQFIKSVGVKAGGTTTQQKHEYILNDKIYNDDPASVIGFNAGVFGEFLNNPVFSIIAEINYVEKGFQKDLYITDAEHPDGTGFDNFLKVKLNYLNFSALAKLRLQSTICTPYVLIGPKLDVEVNSSSNYNYDPIMNEYNKIRFGFKTGIGTEVYLFGINFLAEVIYDKDLGYLYKTNNLRITSSSFEFRGGVSINL